MWLQRSARPSPVLQSYIRSVPSRRPWSSTAAKLDSPEKSSYREGMARYRAFGRPFAKVFLGAVLTYQILYWTWKKLEIDEDTFEKNQQVAFLEKEARELAATQK